VLAYCGRVVVATDIAECIGGVAVTPDGEARVEHKTRLNRGPRLVQFAKPRQLSPEMEVRV
jgi:hypothetical protein